MLKVAATAEQGEGGANDDSGGLGTTAQEASIGSGLGADKSWRLSWTLHGYGGVCGNGKGTGRLGFIDGDDWVRRRTGEVGADWS
ncbi:hypothetical protein M0R45_000531 [Rubus argutus]|uniref:Uncharacterized protein n=1 Tax=Rubus argutus TaxID=59490 RepID=A0AAW1VKH1_RUBAR